MANISAKLSKCVQTTTANVTLIDNATKMQLFADTMDSVNIDIKEERKKINGGWYNGLIYEFLQEKDGSITLSDAISRNDWLAAKCGDIVKGGMMEVFQDPKQYTVSGTTITLESVPVDKTLVVISKVGENATAIDTSKITFGDNGLVTFIDGSNVVDGEIVQVWGYFTQKEAQSIDIDATKGAGTYTAILTMPCVIIDDAGNPHTEFMKQYIFPMCQLDGSFKDDNKSKNDSNKFESKLSVLRKNGTTKLGKIVFFEVGTDITQKQASKMLVNKSK